MPPSNPVEPPPPPVLVPLLPSRSVMREKNASNTVTVASKGRLARRSRRMERAVGRVDAVWRSTCLGCRGTTGHAKGQTETKGVGCGGAGGDLCHTAHDDKRHQELQW